MSDPSDPRDWVERAEEDFKAAQILLRRKKPLSSSSVFHTQQCAEKYLKALLIANGVTPAKTHDLVALSAECLKAGILIPISTTDLYTLTGYAMGTRYPDQDPTLDDAKAALNIAKAVRKFAKGLL